MPPTRRPQGKWTLKVPRTHHHGKAGKMETTDATATRHDAARTYLCGVLAAIELAFDNAPAVRAEVARLALTAPDFRPLTDPRAPDLARAIVGFHQAFAAGYASGLYEGGVEAVCLARLRLETARALIPDDGRAAPAHALLDWLAARIDADRPQEPR